MLTIRLLISISEKSRLKLLVKCCIRRYPLKHDIDDEQCHVSKEVGRWASYSSVTSSFSRGERPARSTASSRRLPTRSFPRRRSRRTRSVFVRPAELRSRSCVVPLVPLDAFWEG